MMFFALHKDVHANTKLPSARPRSTAPWSAVVVSKALRSRITVAALRVFPMTSVPPVLCRHSVAGAKLP